MGAGLAGGPPCLPHSQVLMAAGLAGDVPLTLKLSTQGKTMHYIV